MKVAKKWTYCDSFGNHWILASNQRVTWSSNDFALDQNFLLFHPCPKNLCSAQNVIKDREFFISGPLWQIPNIRLSYRTVKSWWNHRSWKRALFKISRVFNAAKNQTEDRLGYLRFSGFQSNTRILAKYWYDCAPAKTWVLKEAINIKQVCSTVSFIAKVIKSLKKLFCTLFV